MKIASDRAHLITEIYAPVDWDDPTAARYLPHEVRCIMTGPHGAPVIVALGGISGNAEVVACPDGSSGWWPLFSSEGELGSGYRILGFYFAAYESGSYAPPPHLQAKIIDAALSALGVSAAHAIVGASYGGMVTLAWATSSTSTETLLVIISADERPHPQATAIRTIQRRLVDLGRRNGCEDEALGLARGLAMIGYRSAEEYGKRFAGGISGDDPLGPSGPGAYLAARGKAFLGRMSPGRYLSLSASIDRQRVDASAIMNPALLISVEQDQIVPPAQMLELSKRWGGCRSLRTISSIYGHDAFLKESDLIGPMIESFVEGPPLGGKS